jgi:hypothetical protein
MLLLHREMTTAKATKPRGREASWQFTATCGRPTLSPGLAARHVAERVSNAVTLAHRPALVFDDDFAIAIALLRCARSNGAADAGANRCSDRATDNCASHTSDRRTGRSTRCGIFRAGNRRNHN